MPKPAANPDLILFGGAFDPPHLGHRQCLAYAADVFPQAEIWMMPGARPAGAQGHHKEPAATFNQRFAMCEMITHNVPRVSVSAIEGELPSPNFTYQTLEHLKDQAPTRNLAIMIGQDQMRAFPKWQNPFRVLELAHLVVVRRVHSQAQQNSLLSDAEATLDALQLDWHREGELIKVLNDSKSISLLDIEFCAAESSLIREMIATEKSVPADWLPLEILEYINTQSLYRRGEPK